MTTSPTRILVVGAGGREYAVVQKLKASDESVSLSIFAPNLSDAHPIATFGQTIATEKQLWTMASQGVFDMVFIGPEKYLERGMVDRFEDQYHIPCIGPRRALARLETSKAYARNLLSLYMNVNPDYRVFAPEQSEAFAKYVEEKMSNFVVKADGLHGGKGVWVCDDGDDWRDGVAFGKALLSQGESALVEERLRGDEFSLMTFTDGRTCVHMPPIHDFKRAFENDTGPNTGSMGALTHVHPCRLPFLSDADVKHAEAINAEVLDALTNEHDGRTFRGIVYGSYIKVRHPRKGEHPIRVIEYNVRFGDPECMIALHLLKADLLAIFRGIINQTLNKVPVAWSPEACVVKYLVPHGYPTQPKGGGHVTLPPPEHNAVHTFFGACLKTEQSNRYALGTSRTLAALVSSSVSVQDAAVRLNAWLSKTQGPAFFRRDIGLESNVYQLSGVNICEGNRVVTHIQKNVESTFNKHTLSRFGDFSGLFALKGLGYRDPVLVTSVDGVGTKSLFVLKHYAPEVGYAMLGRDLVNHCVNDCLVKGATPLFFLDYFATRRIRADHVGAFVRGVAEACRAAGCVLIGGETAEMPDVYANTEPNPNRQPRARLTIATDVVGTMVGIVERDAIIDGKTTIRDGDAVLGLRSSGPHTNGYSLIRHITKHMMLTKEEVAQLSATHRSYLREIRQLCDAGVALHGLSHITGGGFEENVPRMMPRGLSVQWRDDFSIAPIFQFLQRHGRISNAEMRRVFNCGIGMVMVVSREDVAAVRRLLPETIALGKVVQK